MAIFKKLSSFCKNLFSKPDVKLADDAMPIEQRMHRLERNHIILLKRLLEIDGVYLKTNAFTSKILSTPSDDLNKGFNEPEPTIH